MSFVSDSDSDYLNEAIVFRPSNQGGGSYLDSKSVNMETAQQKRVYIFDVDDMGDFMLKEHLCQMELKLL
jgi:hypothetical protein